MILLLVLAATNHCDLPKKLTVMVVCRQFLIILFFAGLRKGLSSSYEKGTPFYTIDYPVMLLEISFYLMVGKFQK